MLKIILIIFGPIFLFLFLTRNFFNPFKLIYFLGDKGAGKSTLSAARMLRDLSRGWLVYTDMTDCNIPGVRIFDPKNLGKFAPPAFSSIYVDEAGLTFDNRKWESFSDEMRNLFKLQRHHKLKITLSSQGLDVDLKVKTLLDEIYLLTPIRNCITLIRPIIISTTLTEPSAQGEARVAKMYKFAPPWKWRANWMPKYWKYFNSYSAPELPPLPYTEVTDI